MKVIPFKDNWKKMKPLASTEKICDDCHGVCKYIDNCNKTIKTTDNCRYDICGKNGKRKVF